MESTCQFNKLFVIESLNETESQTGYQLVLEVKPTLEASGDGLAYWKAKDKRAFLSALDQIEQQCSRESPRTYPALHIDAHGADNKSGVIVLPSREIVTWSELAERCTRINVACRNNLLVTTGLCYGLLAIKEVSMKRPAPFFALVGPEVEVMPDDVGGFSSFYSELLRSGDVTNALSKLTPDFALFLADRLLLQAYAKYVNEECRGHAKQARRERMLTQFRATKTGRTVNISTARRVVKQTAKPTEASFERFKRTFLLADDPENHDRFQITFADAMRLADALQAMAAEARRPRG